ncbi:MAG: DoxX family protein [Ignavibacteria bacterium]|nr:DoxX family protein [Ignavibacteria bacterium]
MEIIFLIARIVLGLFYLYSASNHFFQVKMMAGYTASKGVPAPKAFVIVSGILLLIGGASILTGYKPTIGIIALVIFFIPVTLMMHNFWTVSDQMMKKGERANFLKNIALLASAVMLLSIPQPWSMSLGK